MKKCLMLLILLYPLVLNAHGGEGHGEGGHGGGGHGENKEAKPKVTFQQKIAIFKKEALNTINNDYVALVKPIFVKKCFDCHSQDTKYRWYHAIPGVKQLMEYDIKEGLSHFDYSDDFPFKSHGESLEDDLKSLLKAVTEDTMPLLRYRLLHWDSKLTKEEKNTIQNWINNSLKILEANKK